MHTISINKHFWFIDNKPFFDQPAESKQEAYEKPVEISKNDDQTTGDSLECLYH